MAEIGFILFADTQNRLLTFLLEEGLVFIPSLHYNKPEYLVLKTVKEINRTINSNSLTGPIFLVKKESKSHNFMFDHFLKNKMNIYYIEQRMGLPCLNFHPSKSKEDYNPPLIIAGSISYYSSYFVDSDYTEVKTPEWIKRIYKETNKFLGQFCKKVKVKDIRRWYWVDKKLLPFLGKTYSTNVIDLDL